MNFAFKFAEVILELRDVPEEARVFCRLIQRVRTDIHEAIRLFNEPAVRAWYSSSRHAAEKLYVQGTIDSAQRAVCETGRLVESIRVGDVQNEHIGMKKRMEWLWRHQSKVITAERELGTCHRSLLSGIGSMRSFCHAELGGFAVAMMATTLKDLQAPTKKETEVMDDLDAFLLTRQRKMNSVRKHAKHLTHLSADANIWSPVHKPSMYSLRDDQYVSPWSSSDTLTSTQMSLPYEQDKLATFPPTLPSSQASRVVSPLSQSNLQAGGPRPMQSTNNLASIQPGLAKDVIDSNYGKFHRSLSDPHFDRKQPSSGLYQTLSNPDLANATAHALSSRPLIDATLPSQIPTELASDENKYPSFMEQDRVSRRARLRLLSGG